MSQGKVPPRYSLNQDAGSETTKVKWVSNGSQFFVGDYMTSVCTACGCVLRRRKLENLRV